MRKKLILGAVLGMTLLAGASAPAATPCLPQQEYSVADGGRQSDVNRDPADSGQLSTALQSELTRKMIQAEKARNAAENDEYGGAITIIAMSIVLSALIILSILFLGFGKVSSAIQKSRKRKAHGVDENTAEDHHDELDSGEVIAAISMALAEHQGQGHDIEDTILTIKRMRKAYSPWNSKIYNMRILPVIPKAKHQGQ